MDANILLTCINNFQDYILTNIKQLILLEHKSIYVITNLCFFEKFEKYKSYITLVSLEDLHDSYSYISSSHLDKEFRGGFSVLTSARFFYLYECMKKYNIQDVVHLENDVVLYYNCNSLLDKIDKNKVYIPFDSRERNIASIVYIPNHSVFKSVLDKYDLSQNDMFNFAKIQRLGDLIENFPIFIEDLTQNEEYQYVTKNFGLFNYIFDAAAMGQYLGGVDPRNTPGDTRGFVNETCIVKYNKYSFDWKIIDNVRRPFILVNGTFYPIFNLHIHCKNLKNFV
jgi:hypothetical protein